MEKHQDVVEALIDHMVNEKVDAAQAVAALLDEDGDATVESVEYEIGEGEELPPCQICGEDALEAVTVESDNGDDLPALHCTNCDTGFVPEGEGAADGDEANVVEAEIDPDDPKCPACGSDDLAGNVEEHEGEELAVIDCRGCGASMLVPDEEETN